MKKSSKKCKIFMGVSLFCYLGFVVMLTEDIYGAVFYLFLAVTFNYFALKNYLKLNNIPLNISNTIDFLKNVFKKQNLYDETKNVLKQELIEEIINDNLSLINPLSKIFIEFSNNMNIYFFGTKKKTTEYYDLNNIILDFYLDIKDFDNLNMLNSIYNKRYFKNKFKKHFKKFLKEIYKNYYNLKSMRLINYDYYTYRKLVDKTVDIFCQHISNIYMVKAFKVFPIKVELEKDIDDFYQSIPIGIKNEMILVFDLLISISLMMKLLVANKVKNKINKNSEFYKILYNLINEFDDIGLIYDRTLDLYKEFYLNELNYTFNEIDYAIIIILLFYDIKNIDGKEELKKIIEHKGEEKAINEDFNNLDYNIKQWLNNIASDLRYIDHVENTIVIMLMEYISNDFELLIKSLIYINNWCYYYDRQLEYHRKLKNKERYLKGDFEEERKIINAKMNYNNIETGSQFEVYLENLFKMLGYKVKHTGKTGDQGADLILKHRDKVYVVQAKYYSKKLDNTPVQEVIGAIKYYNAQYGVVVTNNYFTDGAKKLAIANRVILIDSDDLHRIIDGIYEKNTNEDILMKFLEEENIVVHK